MYGHRLTEYTLLIMLCEAAAQSKTFLEFGRSGLMSDLNRDINSTSKNVVLILVDDLRHLQETDEDLHVPNISYLAGKGIIFENAFAQQALCAPSRNSMLTGRRPDTLHLYDFYSYWRESVGNFTTLPQLFKENGYDTYSVGKVFHPGKSSNFTDDYPYSWSYQPYHPPTEKYKDSAVCMDNITKNLQANLICPVDVKDQPDETLPDIETLHRAIDILNERKHMTKPFLLAVGFHKPHIPLKYPLKYLDYYPIENIKGARQPYRPYGMPQAAWHPWTDLRMRDDIDRLNISLPFGMMPDTWARKIKQSYFACITYIDSLIGQLLENVDTDNTILVFTSDHGWSLGENGLWAKYSNFDVALKSPLIFTIPGIKPRQIKEPVELIDIFPTLVEITGLQSDIPKCSETSKKVLCFEGKSLVPLIKSTESINREFIALSQYPRPSAYPQTNSDKPHLKDITVMGYSVRNARFRYTEWVEFNNEMFTKNWSNLYGVELYDHSFDKSESLNLYKRPGLENLVSQFSNLLRKNFA